MFILAREYKKLLAEFRPRGWWPMSGIGGELKYHPGKFPKLKARQKFEIAAGAVLTQNTAWKNVEKVIGNLRAKNLLTAKKILSARPARLGELIRPAGYWRQKTKKLKILSAAWGALTRHARTPAREELLALWGVGEETADSILLYAFNVPVFVIDVYTRRWLSAQKERGCLSGAPAPDSSYKILQDYFIAALPADYKIFQEFHALLVVWGKAAATNRL